MSKIEIHGIGHDCDDQTYRAVDTDGAVVAEGKAFSLVCESAGVPERDTTDADFYRCGLTGELIKYAESLRYDSEHYVIDDKCFTVCFTVSDSGECFPCTQVGDTNAGTFREFECVRNGDGFSWKEIAGDALHGAISMDMDSLASDA